MTTATSSRPTSAVPWVALLCASGAAGLVNVLPLPPVLPASVLAVIAAALAGALGALLDPRCRRGASDATLPRHYARLGEIAARTTNAIAITDAAERVEWINPAFEQVYGYRLEDLRGRSLRELIVGRYEDRPAIERVDAALAQGRSVTGEFACRHRDGHEVLSRVEITPLRDGAAEIDGYMSVHEDITEQRRAERELSAAEMRFRLLTEAAPIMAWIEDADGTCEWFNDQWSSFVGREPSLDHGEGWLDNLHPEDRERTRRLSREASAARAPYEARYRLRRHDGVYRHVLDRGVPRWDEIGHFLGYVGAAMDVTQTEDQRLELTQTRRLLQDAIDSIDGGLVMFDADDRLVFANQGYRQIYDLSAEDAAPGTPIFDITRLYYTRHPEHLEGMTLEQRIAARRAQHRSAEPSWEMRLGSRWFQVNDRILADGSVISLRTDITALKEATAALNERRELLEIVVHASNDGLWDWHVQSGVLYTSPRLKALLGYRDDEIDSDWARWHSFIHPDDIEAFDAAIARIAVGALEFEVEYRMRTKDGEWRWYRTRAMAIVDEEGATRRVAGSTSDINEQRLREQESARARQLLDEAIEAVDAGIVRFDAEDRLVFCNRRYRELYGIPPALSVPGTRFSDMLRDFFLRHPDCCGRLSVEDIVKFRLAQHRSASGVWEQKLGERWFQVSDRPTADGGVVSLRTDITSFKLIAADLSLAKARAEAASLAKSQFLANVSHELRTPLNGVIGMLQMLDDPAVPPPYAEYVELALRSGRALLDLINDLLDGARIEAGRLQLERVAFEPAEVIADARATVETAARAKGLALEVDEAELCPRRVLGDPKRLRQILTNLLGNAVKFTHHGTVRLRVSCAAGDCVHFEVSDTGIGIPSALQARIFEPFMQAEASTNRRFGGTGLGLSICRSLVRLMGGELRVESVPGVGSRFSFDLPLPEAAAPVAVDTVPALRSDAVDEGQEARVLVVDDVIVNLQVVAALLRRLGAQVTTAQGGREALALVARERYDLVLMDCQMPDMDGIETTEALRARCGSRCPPIVAMTANAGEADRRRAAEAGMCDYLTKPVELAALASLLAKYARPSPAAGDTLVALRASLGAHGFAELVEVFEQTVATRLADLAAAIAADDLVRAAQVAHAVAGVSANLGAARLAAIAGALERQCAAGERPAPTVLGELQDALEGVRTAVAAELAA